MGIGFITGQKGGGIGSLDTTPNMTFLGHYTFSNSLCHYHNPPDSNLNAPARGVPGSDIHQYKAVLMILDTIFGPPEPGINLTAIALWIPTDEAGMAEYCWIYSGNTGWSYADTWTGENYYDPDDDPYSHNGAVLTQTGDTFTITPKPGSGTANHIFNTGETVWVFGVK